MSPAQCVYSLLPLGISPFFLKIFYVIFFLSENEFFLKRNFHKSSVGPSKEEEEGDVLSS